MKFTRSQQSAIKAAKEEAYKEAKARKTRNAKIVRNKKFTKALEKARKQGISSAETKKDKAKRLGKKVNTSRKHISSTVKKIQKTKEIKKILTTSKKLNKARMKRGNIMLDRFI